MSDTERVRDMERIVLRAPEGIRERLAARALANQRSMNAEALSIIQDALDRPHRSELERFQYELERVNRELSTLNAMVAHGEERRNALLTEMHSFTMIDRSGKDAEIPLSRGDEDRAKIRRRMLEPGPDDEV